MGVPEGATLLTMLARGAAHGVPEGTTLLTMLARAVGEGVLERAGLLAPPARGPMGLEPKPRSRRGPQLT